MQFTTFMKCKKLQNIPNFLCMHWVMGFVMGFYLHQNKKHVLLHINICTLFYNYHSSCVYMKLHAVRYVTGEVSIF